MSSGTLMNIESPVEARDVPSPSAPPPPTIVELARRRVSCRRYRPEPMSAEQQRALQARLEEIRTGPFGSQVRMKLLMATGESPDALKGLGTYGFVRGATAFLVGAVRRNRGDLEDFGHAMERAVLAATALDLGTCWLGGSFTKSRFARSVEATEGEIVPAVAAVGLPETEGLRGALRTFMRSSSRLGWEELFFDGSFRTPLTRDKAGPYATPLETLRIGPSASNKQPWRVVRRGSSWDFHLQRTPGYGPATLTFRLLGIADLQRTDLGIAMCHFELAAKEAGLEGRWSLGAPAHKAKQPEPELIASWVEGAPPSP
jgi:nitroreductase